MIDLAGTEFRNGRLILPRGFKSRHFIQWWEPQGDQFHYKIVARSGGGVILWQGNFVDMVKALTFWRMLRECGPAPHQWDLPLPSWHPGLLIPGVVYEFAVVTGFTSGTTNWQVPGGVIAAQYLAVAGGGGGGNGQAAVGNGGGGGAGGMREGTANLATGSVYSVVVGAAVGAQTKGNNTSITGTGVAILAIGGGYGHINGAGGPGGSGGGGGPGVGGGAGTAGQGSNGGSGYSTGAYFGGGGGGGKNGGGGFSNVGGNGGAGAASSISGSSLFYAGGGGGGSSPDGSGGSGASGVGGSGTTGAGGHGATNRGGGGGGAGSSSPSAGGNGGSGVAYLSSHVSMIRPFKIRNFIEKRQGFAF